MIHIQKIQVIKNHFNYNIAQLPRIKQPFYYYRLQMSMRTIENYGILITNKINDVLI